MSLERPLEEEAAGTTTLSSPHSIYRVPALCRETKDQGIWQSRSVLLTHTDVAFGVGGRGPVLRGVPAGRVGTARSWVVSGAPPTAGWRAGLPVCLHATAQIRGVPVYSVTNSATVPPFEDLPLPLDSHFAATAAARLPFLGAAGSGFGV